MRRLADRILGPWPPAAQALALALILFGAAVRLWDLGAVGLWHDEAWLLLDVREPTLSASIWGRNTPYGNSTPAGFTLILRGLAGLSKSELALRMPAAFFGVAALAVLPWTLSRAGWPPAAMLASLAWWATNRKAIDFSKEIKQYSAEAFCALALLSLYLALRDRPLSRRGLLCAALAASAYALSHTAILAAAPVAALLLWEARRFEDGRRRALVAAIHAAAWLALWAFVLRGQRNGALERFWAEGFPEAMSGLPAHLWEAWPALFRWRFKARHAGLFVALHALGLILLWRRDKRLALALMGPAVTGALAAGLGLYPFGAGRLTSDLEACLMLPLGLAVGLGCERLGALAARRGWPARRVELGLACILAAFMAQRCARKQLQKPLRRPAASLIAELRERWRPGDEVLLFGAEARPLYDALTWEWDGPAPHPMPAYDADAALERWRQRRSPLWVLSTLYEFDPDTEAAARRLREEARRRGQLVWEREGTMLLRLAPLDDW